MKKSIILIIGILISCIFIYLSLSGVEFDKINILISDLNYIYLIPVILLNLSLPVLRSFRLKFVVKHLNDNIKFINLIPITSIGYLLITILPLRLGEFLIPYLLSKKYDISMLSAMGSIFIERLLDLIILFIIFFIVVVTSIFPKEFINETYYIIIICGMLFIILVPLILYIRPRFIVGIYNFFIKLLSKKYRDVFESIVTKTINGFRVVMNPIQLIQIITVSLCIFLVYALIIYNLFLFQKLNLTFFSVFIVLIANVIAVTLPAAPGMVGNIHYACIVALMFQNVSKTEAFLYSNYYYFTSVGVTIIVGLIFIPFVNLSLKELREKIKLQFNKS